MCLPKNTPRLLRKAADALHAYGGRKAPRRKESAKGQGDPAVKSPEQERGAGSCSTFFRIVFCVLHEAVKRINTGRQEKKIKIVSFQAHDVNNSEK